MTPTLLARDKYIWQHALLAESIVPRTRLFKKGEAINLSKN